MKKFSISTAITVIVALLGVVALTISSVDKGFDSMSLCAYAVYALLLFYAVWGYKKPHGNLLKYLILAFGLSRISSLITYAKLGLTVNIGLGAVAMMAVAYMAGRLDKIERNRYIAVLVQVLLIVTEFITQSKSNLIFDQIHIIAVSSGVVLWCSLCGAYFTRFSQHQKAGLADYEAA